jgi:hypothetical protein
MKMPLRVLVGLAALTLALAGPGLAPAEVESNPARKLDHRHPENYLLLAKLLFERGEKDEAVFWFYVGQLRYRVYLATHPNLDPTGEPAIYSVLFRSLSPPINQYAFGDIPKLLATIDRVLAWDAENEDVFAPKGPERDKVREGLIKMKLEVIATKDQIRATRRSKGLENRN